MKISVMYFAAMREQAEKSQEMIDTNAKTPNELFSELNEKYHFTLDKDHLKVAINEQYASFNSPLTEMDTIVFIPPVAGG